MRRIFEIIEVETDSHAAPVSLLWRGRDYAVIRVLDRWRYCGNWWLNEQEQQRRYYRLETNLRNGRTKPIMEVFEQGETWTLSRLCD